MVQCTQPLARAPSPAESDAATHAPVWSCIQPSGKAPHKCCCLSVVPFRGKLYFYGGGVIKKIFEDLFEFDIDAQSWRVVPTTGHPVLPTLSHTAVVHDSSMVVFGGMTDGRCHNNLYALDLEAMVWSPLTAATTRAPPCRKGHSAVVHKSKLYILMGADYVGTVHNDFHTYDFETREWACLEDSPRRQPNRLQARTGHSAVVHDNVMYVFGGMSNGHPCKWLNDLHAYDLDARSWRALDVQPGPVPPGRYSHTCWADAASMYIFGGDSSDCSVYYNDLWSFDFDTLRWRLVKCQGDRPSRRSGHATAVHNGTVYLFGGEKPVDGKSSEVAYSNSIFQLPLFADATTTLKDLVCRFLVSHQILGQMDLSQRAAIPAALLETVDRMQPKRRRVCRSETSDSDSELEGLAPLARPSPSVSPPSRSPVPPAPTWATHSPPLHAQLEMLS